MGPEENGRPAPALATDKPPAALNGDVTYPPVAAPRSSPGPPAPSVSQGESTSKSHQRSNGVAIAPQEPLVNKTLADYIAKHPDHTVKQATRALFPKPNALNRFAHRFKVKHSVIDGLSKSEMAHWEGRGAELRRRAGWKLPGEDGPGAEVSPLFWKMYLSIMPTLVRDPLSGIAAPDLLGSTSTLPLTIISLIPDIMKHYHDVIVRTEREIFLATNYWQPSDSVNMVSKALRTLSARVVKEGRPKVVVKVMYDRGSWEQLWNAHAPVTSEIWSKLDLPASEEVPGLHLEVVNFHRVLLGTFHVKFLIVDRKVALINSCNIQDRPNLEMMQHFEGPIIDAFYDVALHSWYNKLDPPLPFIDKPYNPPRDADGNIRYLFRDRNPYLRDIEIVKAARAARMRLRQETKDIQDEQVRYQQDAEHPTRDRLVEAVRQVMANQRLNLAHKQEEIAQRSATAMKELRDIGGRMGLQFSSRPGSRRTSISDLSKLHRDVDDETAAITAQNRTNTLPAPPSEAQTSPTLHEFPTKSTKSKTMSDAGTAPFESNDDGATTVNSSRRQSFHSAVDHFEDAHDDLHDDPRHLKPLQIDQSNFGQSFMSGSGPESSGIEMTPVARGVPIEPRSLLMAELAPQVVVDSPLAESPFEEEHATTSSETQVPEPSGAATPAARSFRWADDLPSGAQSPYVPRMSIDEEIPPGRGTKRMFKLSKRFNAGALSEAWATVEDSDELDAFQPHVVHEPHDPFPIAMACRRPHGMPGHQDIRNPQNAAWLAGCRYAQRTVFIQTPTFNARPLVRAVKQACRRGVEVTLLVDLGFNDMAESIMFQGGTNEQVVDRLYKKLGKEGKSKHLHVYWYTSKDQIRPLNAITKQRNCHIKFAAYDDEVMILGNANGDTQSVFHSSEVNVMIDNKQVTAEIMKTLMANQNTMQYGGVQADGVWRDEEGKTLKDYGLAGGGGFTQGFKAFIRFAKTAAK